MIEHVWTVICSKAVIDRTTNNVSLQTVLEQLEIKGEPKPDGLVPMQFDVMSLWSRSDDNKPCEGFVRLTYVSPSGKALINIEGKINLLNTERFRSNIHSQGIPIGEGGRYKFKVDLQQEGEKEWSQVASIPFTVIFSPLEVKDEEDDKSE
ncbi:hypothetical protein ACFLV7_01045 [Chloroflexota bacterium]